MPDFGFIQQILYFFIVITPVVFIHELGHYWVARRAGVVVDVFSIGFGPELYAWKDKYGTRWRIAAIPLGGYVKMRGDENPASMGSSKAGKLKGSFLGARLPWRMAIVAAGPAANFLLGIVLFAIVYMSVGKAFIPAIIGEVRDGSPAQHAGIKQDDKVLSVDGRTIRDFNALRVIVFENPEQTLMFEIERRGQILTLPVTTRSVHSQELGVTYGQLGVQSAAGEVKRLGISKALLTATSDTVYMGKMMILGIGRLVSGQAGKGEIGGPVRIAEMSKDAANQGFATLLVFTALISINLGLINLLPIPALDGGHLLFFTIEAIIGRPLPEQIQSLLMKGGIALLLTLMIFVTVFDVARKFIS